jgi:hypothetical protein
MPTAAPIRAAGHDVHTPTIAGNRPGDAKTVGLSEAIKSIVDYLAGKNLKDVVLVGHSYGGMVITGVADQVPDKIRRQSHASQREVVARSQKWPAAASLRSASRRRGRLPGCSSRNGAPRRRSHGAGRPTACDRSDIDAPA